MSMSVNLHRATKAEYRKLSGPNDTLEFCDEDGSRVSIFVPPHVAAKVAATFNEVMAESVEVPEATS